MSVGAYGKPTIRYVGNVRDLLAMICSVKEDGWVLEFGRQGWRVRICPMAGVSTGPFRMAIYSPAGVNMMQKVGDPSLEEAVTAAVSYLRVAGIDPGEQQMLAVARGIDSGSTF